MKLISGLLLALILVASPALAEAVQVAPGVQVTKKTYPAPINEQPFFGFAAKTSAQTAADDKFVSQITTALGSRQSAMNEALKRGWIALSSGDFSTAGRRFNEAYLLVPEQSRVYHAFAVLVHTRFHDAEYADELFRQALKQPNPAPSLRADYGRFLLIMKRPSDARPLLEQAVTEAPKYATAWSNLAFARLETADRPGACAAAAEAERLSNSRATADVALLKQYAHC